ncbi:class II glutamine amidotransferase [Thalassotalea insulae]|uniref:Class II glutamine amidotransferase n=1 Tax=Thalassotalea insulae TaxID=2056778 RepID=A0ABQ6GV27_9GAMM|nr:class II glutamine amidotransferase [Thalassotalea insulae]GLX79785.1 class II glutamine amidotransferase [Thalassotalea insulae]
MCRFIAYTGEITLMEDLLFNAENSLVRQSKQAKMRVNPLNGDGFGVGWYPTHSDELPGTFVSIEPAWSNRNLSQIATKIPTKHFFAHVRDASVGMPVSQSNCHPFQYGRYLWMHNGRLDQFSCFRRLLLSELSDQAFDFIKGNTDSECAFALFLDEIAFDQQASHSKLVQGMRNTIEKISDYRRQVGASTNAFINFALTNGQESVFTRYSTLADVRPASLFYHQEGENIIVSSEPVTENSDYWTKVERNTLLSVCANKVVAEALF